MGGGKGVKLKSLENLLDDDENAEKREGDIRRNLVYLTCLLDGTLSKEAMHV